jgi:hypothetical protein
MQQPTNSAPSRPTWITTADESTDHAVTEDAMAAGITSPHGEYRALCGERFQPAALVSPPGPPCQTCARILRARKALATLRTRSRRVRRNRPTGRHRAH